MTAKKKTASKPQAVKPKIVAIPWWNRPMTWGIAFLVVLLLVVSAFMGTSGPEVVTAQEPKPVIAPVVKPTPEPIVEPEPAKVAPQVLIVRIDKSDNSVRNIDRSDRRVTIIDRSDHSVRINRTVERTPSKPVESSGQRSAACEEYRKQHEAITARWASVLADTE